MACSCMAVDESMDTQKLADSTAARINNMAVHALDEENYSENEEAVTLYDTRTNGADTNHGAWACAKVTTIVLREAGVVKRLYLGVRHVEAALKRKKWRRIASEDELLPGDVVVWVSRIKGRKDKKCTGGGNCHVGIVTSEGYFHNSPITDKPTLGGWLPLIGVKFKVGFRPPN